MAEGAPVPGGGAPGRWGRTAARLAAGLDRADAAQQRRPVTALPAAVVRKYAEDRAGLLAGQIAYAAFLALFPMLLVLLTLVDVVLSGHPRLQNDVVDAALRQFPVLGPELRKNVHGLSSGNVVVLVALLAWSLWGSLRLGRNAQVMMAEVWGDDRGGRPGFWRRLPRHLGFLAVIGVGFLAGGALAGVASAGRLGSVSAWVALVPLVAVNVAMYWGAFTVLAGAPDPSRSYWRGAAVAGVGWTVLQVAGAQIVAHQIRHFTALYGAFWTVLVLLWWMALGAMLTVVAAEVDVVVVRHLWPRPLRRDAGGPPD